MPAIDPWEDEDEDDCVVPPAVRQAAGAGAGAGAGLSAEADLQRVTAKLHKDGYRQGKQAGEEREMQRAFDEGFGRGMQVARACGALYGSVRVLLSPSTTRQIPDEQARADDQLLEGLERLLFEVVPEADCLTADHVRSIATIVNSINSSVSNSVLPSQEPECLVTFRRDIAALVTGLSG